MRTTFFIAVLLSHVFVYSLFSQSQHSVDFQCQRGSYFSTLSGPLPYIETNMPLDVMACYIVADTLCKLYDGHELASIAAGLSDDSINIAFKSLIAAQNYNPQLYRHMLFHTSIFNIPGYHASYGTIEDIIEENFYSRIQEKNFYDSLREQGSGGIYYVKVIDQEHYVDSTVNVLGSKYADRYCASLQVITAIYGYGTPWICSIGDDEATAPCQKVSWQRLDSLAERYASNSTEYYNVGPGLLAPGEEYIVIIMNWCDRPKGPSTIEFENYPHKVFHVVNDIVYDPKHYFKRGDSINKYTLINELHQKVNHY